MTQTALKRNNVKVLGRGSQAMLLAHGYGCDQGMWRHVTPAFLESHRLVLFDHVGAGQSDITAYSRTRHGSLRGYAQDVLEICRELDLKDAIFVGHSVSATIGILAAIDEPSRFEKLILICPSPCYVNDGDYVGGFEADQMEGLLESLESNYTGWASAMAPTIMGNPERPELGEELAQSFCRADPEIARHFARVTFLSDNRADLPRLKTPALILQCSEDVIAPPAVGEYLHRHLAGSRLQVLGATGHCPHLSAPEETIAAMKTFLS
ncbi:MAG TPA: alpha/beta hydrolase [Myxococcus sp.]|jgi:sigma-B regulation protein RsbQ|nr:alpha/beta hydrolase [Myxococcus sp.]